METPIEHIENLADLALFSLEKNETGVPDATDVGAGPWRFRGIASDTSPDVDEDEILRKHLDLTYADSRGFVNWDHSKAPEDQVGHLTKAQLITPAQVAKFQEELGDGVKLSKTASVFVEGELYQYVPRAEAVAKLIKSAPPGKGVGLSLQGALARDSASDDIVRAFVRGVAITPVPAHPRTLLHLSKSLRAAQESAGSNEQGVNPEVLRAITEAVDGLGSDLRKSLGIVEPNQLTQDEAVMVVLKSHPRWSYSLATDVVRYAMQKENA